MVSGLIIVAGTAIGLAFLTQLINKLLINEKFVDETREKMKKMQKELKGIDVKSKEFQQKQDKILEMNFALMKQQFKPMFVTFVPYIVIFYLLGGLFSYAPISVGSQIQIDVSGNALIESPCLGLNETIQGKGTLIATVNSENCKILINGNEANISLIGASNEINLNVEDVALKILPPKQVFINLPFDLPVVGNQIGWLGTFIIFSFATSMILNKALKGIYLRKWE